MFLRHALNSMVRETMETLKERGAGKLVVGHPRGGIARQRGNKLTVNFCNYGYTMRRLKEVGGEGGLGGIDVVEVGEAYTSKTCYLCGGEAHENGRIKRGLFGCPRTGGKVINADSNGAINIPHISESRGGAGGGGQPPARDGGGNRLKVQPMVYRWTNGAGGWVNPTSDEVMKMKAVNHKPVNRPPRGGTLALQGGGEEVRLIKTRGGVGGSEGLGHLLHELVEIPPNDAVIGFLEYRCGLVLVHRYDGLGTPPHARYVLDLPDMPSAMYSLGFTFLPERPTCLSSVSHW